MVVGAVTSGLFLLGPKLAFSAQTTRSLTDVVRRYADTLLEKARDTYGPQKTGLLLSALDRSTFAPCSTTRPAAPQGIRESDRAGVRQGPLVGANPSHDQDVFRVFYILSSMPGESDRYRQAADQEISWFFKNTLTPPTNLVPWGEHLSWNVMTDTFASGLLGPTYEFGGAWPLWERSFELAPDECARFAQAVWEHMIGDHKTGAFDRHVGFLEHRVTLPGMEFARHAGFMINLWGHAYAHTKNPTFLTAIETLLNRFESKRHPKTGLIEQCCGRQFAMMTQTLAMAIDCHQAAGRVPEPLSSRLRAFATREDEIFCSLTHEPRGQGFLNGVALHNLAPYPGRGKNPEPPYSPAWESHYGGVPTCFIAQMCDTRYGQGNYSKYVDLIVAAADKYLSTPPGTEVDLKPGVFALVINTELSGYRLTKKDIYLKRAQEMAWTAVDLFWQDNSLPRASSSVQHYESMTGAGSLSLALLRVQAATEGKPMGFSDDTER
jgi:hypothetical protein